MKKLLNSQVSIIITCYNYGQHIEEAIKSALEQSYKNIEVIVIDDGSTDNTKNICSKFSKQINYTFQRNSGVAVARNNGIKMAHGEYVILLDADDRLNKHYVQQCLDHIRKHQEVGYVFTQVRHFGDESFDTNYPDFDIAIIMKSGPYINVSALIKKDCFNYKKFNPKITTGYEDWDLYLGFYEHGITGSLLNKPLLEYRRVNAHRGISSKTETLIGLYRAKINVMNLHPKLFSRKRIMVFKLKYWIFQPYSRLKQWLRKKI